MEVHVACDNHVASHAAISAGSLGLRDGSGFLHFAPPEPDESSPNVHHLHFPAGGSLISSLAAAVEQIRLSYQREHPHSALLFSEVVA